MVVRGLSPLLSCLFVRGLCPLLPCVFVRGLYLLPSCIFVTGLCPLPCSTVDFLAARSKSFLVVTFVINSGILLTDVLTFWGGSIRLCSDMGCFSL